ncbi:hypothetical [Yersinia pestis KIM10+]|uniref:Uncharacterized protein n=1 Tax=Yersinia pestis TaxID=632 RepID=Q8CLP0_YERPE|nr:hypothetical [Yersinia pestis KIM10+]
MWHKLFRSALPERFIQPLSLFLAFTGDQHPLARTPTFSRDLAGQRFVRSQLTGRRVVFEQVEGSVFHKFSTT